MPYLRTLAAFLLFLTCAVLTLPAAAADDAGAHTETTVAQASDFIHPTGELTDAMFPGETVLTNVQAWLSQAQAKTSVEEAQAAWVYYRAFSAVANRLNIEAAELDVDDQLARRRLREQIRYFAERAREQLEQYGNYAASRSRHSVSACAPDRTFDSEMLCGFI